ncbi:MAG: trigger factor family protein, partial [Phycisphaerales bacterium JB037]
MADTATQDRPNTVTIEDAGPSRKKVTIEIPAETVDEKLGDSLDTLSLEAQLPGFRKGKAPRALIEKKFGSAVRDEAKNQLVASAYQQAVEEHKLRVVGDPIAEELAEVEVVACKPLTFSIDVEVSPEFTLPSLE